jgi:hypothetical protein
VLVAFASVGNALELTAGNSSLAIENADYVYLLSRLPAEARISCCHLAIEPADALARTRAEAALRATEGRAKAAGTDGEASTERSDAELGTAHREHIAREYAAAIERRSARGSPVDWSRVRHGVRLSALAAHALPLRWLVAGGGQGQRTHAEQTGDSERDLPHRLPQDAQQERRQGQPSGRAEAEQVQAEAHSAVVLVLDGYDVLHGLSVSALAAAACAHLRAVGISLPHGAASIRSAVRLMSETSAVSAGAVRALAGAAAVWVPALNSADALARSGVDTRRLPVRVLPQLAAPIARAVPSAAPDSDAGQSAAISDPGSGRGSGSCRGNSGAGNCRGNGAGSGAGNGGPSGVGNGGATGGCTFLSIVVGLDGWHFERKGVDVLLRAFARAFCADQPGSASMRESDGAKLVLKLGSPTDCARVQAFLSTARLADKLRGRLEIRTGWLEADELDALIAYSDVFVLPSRGEGWCRPLADAMALGKLVVGVPGSGGPAAFLDETVGWCVRSRQVPAARRTPGDGTRDVRADEMGEWAEPDEAHLAQILAHLCVHRSDTDVVAKAHAAAERMATLYSEQPIQRRLVELVTELACAAVSDRSSDEDETPIGDLF